MLHVSLRTRPLLQCLQPIVVSYLPIEDIEDHLKVLCSNTEVYHDYLLKVCVISKRVPSSERLTLITKAYKILRDLGEIVYLHKIITQSLVAEVETYDKLVEARKKYELDMEFIIEYIPSLLYNKSSKSSHIMIFKDKCIDVTNVTPISPRG